MNNPTDYALLYQSVKGLGLLEKDQLFYIRQALFISILFVVGLIIIDHLSLNRMPSARKPDYQLTLTKNPS